MKIPGLSWAVNMGLPIHDKFGEALHPVCGIILFHMAKPYQSVPHQGRTCRRVVKHVLFVHSIDCSVSQVWNPRLGTWFSKLSSSESRWHFPGDRAFILWYWLWICPGTSLKLLMRDIDPYQTVPPHRYQSISLVSLTDRDDSVHTFDGMVSESRGRQPMWSVWYGIPTNFLQCTIIRKWVYRTCSERKSSIRR